MIHIIICEHDHVICIDLKMYYYNMYTNVEYAPIIIYSIMLKFYFTKPTYNIPLLFIL